MQQFILMSFCLLWCGNDLPAPYQVGMTNQKMLINKLPLKLTFFNPDKNERATALPSGYLHTYTTTVPVAREKGPTHHCQTQTKQWKIKPKNGDEAQTITD